MSKLDIEEFIMIIFIILIIIGAIFCIGVNIQEGNKDKINSQTINNTENCEHEWVNVSRYNYWTGSYKIISKCTKCGKEIR